MKTLKLRDQILMLRRVYPKIDPKTRFLYEGRLNKRAVGDAVMVHMIAWSEDGRVTLHKTIFRRKGLSIVQWHEWLKEHAGKVLRNQVRTYMNRTFGSIWNIDKIIGWHFTDQV